MSLRIGINGFGRIGRMVFRLAIEQDDIEIVAINDLLDINHLAYLLKYDSVHGNFNGSILVDGNNLIVNNKSILITAERNPEDIPWGKMNTDVVAECTGIFTSIEMANLHVNGGAKKKKFLKYVNSFMKMVGKFTWMVLI